MCGPPPVEQQIPETARARGISEQQVINDVLLLAPPTKQFAAIAQVAAPAVFPASDDAASTAGTIQPMNAGWTAH